MASALWALLLKSFEPVEELDRILTRAWIALEKHLYFAFDAQGAPYEGPAYAGNTLGSLALMAEVLHRQGKPNLLFHRTFERHPAHLAAEWIPGFSGVNNLNDSAHPSGSVSGSLFWMNRTGGEILPWLAQRLDLAPDRLASRGLMTNSALREYLNFLLWWDEKIPVRSPDDLGWPLSRCFPIRGVASHRTGWSSSDVLVSHFCGRQEVLCHRQGDQNHVAFYYAGDHLLVDAGYGSGHKDMSKAMDRWFGLTEAHNCVMIDGMNQRGVIESPGWCEGEMIDFHDAPDVSVSTGDASSATGVDHRVAQSVRQVALHRSGSSPLVTVWDRNEKDGQIFKTEVLWHTHVNHRIEGNSHGGVIHAKNCDCHVFVLNLRGENLEVIAEIGFGRPRLRVCMVAAVSELVTVFVPVPVGSPRPSIRWESEDPPARRLRVSVSGRKDVMVDICSP
jgi:hypothetical protein